MIRIDDETLNLLRAEFGTLGNALFHTAEGLSALRAKGLSPEPLAAPKPLKAYPEPPPKPKPEAAPALPEADWTLLQALIQDAADRAHRPHPNRALGDADRLEALLRRLEAALGRPPRGQAF
jgi:hypothetical protein